MTDKVIHITLTIFLLFCSAFMISRCVVDQRKRGNVCAEKCAPYQAYVHDNYCVCDLTKKVIGL